MKTTDIGTPLGWEELTKQFQEEMRQTARKAAEQFLSVDWKEKWGALDANFFFDTDEFYNALSNVIAKYREESKTICARCGGAAKMKSFGGYMLPMCDDCEEDMKNGNY